MGRTRRPEELTERQREVLRMVERGHTNSEIAEALGISVQGAKWHVRELLGKYGVESREELIEARNAERGLGATVGRMWAGIVGLGLPKVTGAAIAGGIAVAGVAVGILVAYSLAESDDDLSKAAVLTTVSPGLIDLADCPVTVPASPFVPSGPSLAQPPDYYKTAWFGSDALWTMLEHDGENWSGLPGGAGGFSQKTWWWSQRFEIDNEPTPAITVTGRRLDAPGEFTAGNPGTHGAADFGTAMLVGIEVPSAGCWQIRAEYKSAELAYVVLVE